jgi:predicted metal-dependent hydrolase
VVGVPPDRFPPGFGPGVRLFNAGDFFAAHEAFEEILDAAEGSDCWECLVALIQVAVGYHKSVSGHAGAARMLGLGAAKLAPLPAVFRRVAVDRLRRRVAEDVATLERGGSLASRLMASPPRIEMIREPARPAG